MSIIYSKPPQEINFYITLQLPGRGFRVKVHAAAFASVKVQSQKVGIPALLCDCARYRGMPTTHTFSLAHFRCLLHVMLEDYQPILVQRCCSLAMMTLIQPKLESA